MEKWNLKLRALLTTNFVSRLNEILLRNGDFTQNPESLHKCTESIADGSLFLFFYYIAKARVSRSKQKTVIEKC